MWGVAAAGPRVRGRDTDGKHALHAVCVSESDAIEDMFTRLLQGMPNTDFVVRELRAVTNGPMAMIRCVHDPGNQQPRSCLSFQYIETWSSFVTDTVVHCCRYGTCGGFGPVKPGDIVIAKQSIASECHCLY